MVLKIVVVCVVVVLGVGDVTPALVNPVQDSNPQPREWPCPDETDFLPCTCTSNQQTDLKIDCSGVKSNLELQRVFTSIFPFTDFLELRIVQDPYDDAYDLNTLDPFVFAGLSFERVIIQGTKIKEVNEQVFTDSHNHLNYLNLANNDIYDFPFETIQLYTRLANLILDDNNLITLPNIVSTTLQSISVSGNSNLQFKANVFNNASMLSRISLARNNIQEFPQHVFQNLDYVAIVDLSGNEMTFVNEFTFDPPRETLLQISLDNNKIDLVHYNSIKGLMAGAHVSLAGNQIIYLQEVFYKPILDQLPSGSLDLSRNPLLCGCDIHWLYPSDPSPYLSIITDTTKCYDGTLIHFLIPSYFALQCPAYTTVAPKGPKKH
nr:oplophorus-luciferin 2-monooxygenase non-catalytic subunit-like [Procambarus clarkii]